MKPVNVLELLKRFETEGRNLVPGYRRGLGLLFPISREVQEYLDNGEAEGVFIKIGDVYYITEEEAGK